jgi:hypothetical protein
LGFGLRQIECWGRLLRRQMINCLCCCSSHRLRDCWLYSLDVAATKKDLNDGKLWLKVLALSSVESLISPADACHMGLHVGNEAESIIHSAYCYWVKGVYLVEYFLGNCGIFNLWIGIGHF